MRKVSESEFTDFISWARANTANRVYPCSIAEGIQPGDIYVNDGAATETVFFWHYCGFGYISGKASEAFLNDICSEMISGHNGRRLLLITKDDDITAFFQNRNMQIDYRAEYLYRPEESRSGIYTDRFRIEQIDAENISMIEGRIIPSFSWDTPERFLREGFGYIALDQEKICAAAFSAAVSSDEIDIGAQTHEEYRRKGLAAMLAGKMCERIVRTGKRPVWAHGISNKGSMNTALKCGFVQARINTVIRICN